MRLDKTQIQEIIAKLKQPGMVSKAGQFIKALQQAMDKTVHGLALQFTK